MLEKTDPQVIQIERENLELLIEQLKREIRLTGSFKNLPQADVSSNEGLQKSKIKKETEVALLFAQWINENQWCPSITDEHGWEKLEKIDSLGKLHYIYAETNLLFEMFNGKSN